MATTNTGTVIWLYGRPCAGKTTIAGFMSEQLKNQGHQVVTLDGDELRNGMNADLGFSPEDRQENIRRTSELAKLLASKGKIVICSLVTPSRVLRNVIKNIVPEANLMLVFVDTSLEACIKRDVKGHYKKAFDGEIENFTGINAPFEGPAETDSDLVVHTDNQSIGKSAAAILKVLNQQISNLNTQPDEEKNYFMGN